MLSNIYSNKYLIVIILSANPFLGQGLKIYSQHNLFKVQKRSLIVLAYRFINFDEVLGCEFYQHF